MKSLQDFAARWGYCALPFKELLRPLPPTGQAFGLWPRGLRRHRLLAQQQTARGFERHDEFVVAQETVGGTFRERTHEGVAGRLRDLRHDEVRRCEGRVDLRDDD